MNQKLFAIFRSGFDDILERDTQDVICSHPSSPSTQEGTPAPVTGNNTGGRTSRTDYGT
ncbi:MAG TPA: hypothetical protein VFJ05_03855 [Nitrososphaeraceae archaeon]|nr:hypothetical protein [Nitrososphaeraceae archaeon]